MKKLFSILFLSLTSVAFASVSVSTTTVSGQSVTVNTSAAHGLVVNQADCLSAPANACGVVTAVNNTTQYVLLVAGTTPTPCSSACGSETPAPQVIVLTSVTNQGYTIWNWLTWTTNTQPCPGPNASQWVAANGSAGATAAQISAIKNGLIVETFHSSSQPSGVPIANIETMMQQAFTTDQNSNSQPCQFYGFTFDNTDNAWVKQ